MADTINQTLEDTNVGVGKLNTSVACGFKSLSSELNRIHTAILALTRNGPLPTSESFVFIKLLNQVEDLITDHDFSKEKNNASLHNLWHEPPTRKGHDRLEEIDSLLNGSPLNLASRFEAVHGAFESDDVDERADRWAKLDQLRRDIVIYFARSSPGGGTVGAAAKQSEGSKS